MGKMLRVDMTDLTAKSEDVPEKYKNMGGRWLTTSIVCDEVDPTCHPLGPNNKFVAAPGMVTGTAAPTSARISVGGKSPLTGTIKEANAGSALPQYLARLGIKGVVVEGSPKEDGRWWGLKLSTDGAEFFPADEWAGKGLHEVYPQLFSKFGDHVGIMSIGVAGEMKMSNAGVCFNDRDGRPARYAARGGLGTVLGTKGLKFLVVDPAGAPQVPLADQELFDKGRVALRDALQTHAVTKPGGALNSYGTQVLINIVNEAGGLPTRNFREGRFEGASKISGEAMAELCEERGGAGVMGHGCSPGCIIKCSNVWPNPDGSEMVSCIEYETAWAFGANCAIDDLDVLGKLTWQSNDIGLDTIEAGGAIAVAMDGGLLQFGDGAGAIELMEEIRKGTPLGRILGNGAATTGRAFGVHRVPGVKGQNMPAYEPRAIKGIGVTYATSTMGADHTAGYTIAPEILAVGGDLDAMEVEGKAKVSRDMQAATNFVDSSGHCLFIAFAILDIAEGFQGLLDECNGVLGTDWTGDDVTNIGLEIMKKEWEFNKAAGFTRAEDRVPEFMKYEKLPPHNGVWDVPDEMLDTVYKF